MSTVIPLRTHPVNLRADALALDAFRAEAMARLLPEGVALNDRVARVQDELRESAPDVHDEARTDEVMVRAIDPRLLRELTTITDPAFTMADVAHVARELETLGIRPCVRFHRNGAGLIDGVTIAREIVKGAA